MQKSHSDWSREEKKKDLSFPSVGIQYCSGDRREEGGEGGSVYCDL